MLGVYTVHNPVYCNSAIVFAKGHVDNSWTFPKRHTGQGKEELHSDLHRTAMSYLIS